jgi:intergrase/recombinase
MVSAKGKAALRVIAIQETLREASDYADELERWLGVVRPGNESYRIVSRVLHTLAMCRGYVPRHMENEISACLDEAESLFE